MPPPAWVHVVLPPAVELPQAWRHAVPPPAWGHAVATVPCRQGAVPAAAMAPGRRAETVTGRVRIGTESSSSPYLSWHAHLT